MPIPAVVGVIGKIIASAAAGAAANKLLSSSSSSGGSQMAGSYQKYNKFNKQQQSALKQVLDMLQKSGINKLGQQPYGVGAPPGNPNLTRGLERPVFNQQGYNELQDLNQSDQYGFEPIAQFARHQFYTSDAPSIRERFANLGGASSDKEGELAKHSALLELGLNAQRSQYANQQREQTFNEQSTQNEQQLQLDELRNALGLNQNKQRLDYGSILGDLLNKQGELGLQRYGAKQTSLYNRGALFNDRLKGLLGAGFEDPYNSYYTPPAARQQGFFESFIPKISGKFAEGVGEYGARKIFGG